MALIIHKFGGTSVGSAERFAAAAEIVARQEHQPVVVVSAMSGVTNQLIAGARAAAEGRDTVYREIKAGLLTRHLGVVDALLTRSRERLEVGGFIEDRLHELERLYRSIAVLGEVTARGLDTVASFGEQLSSHILAATLRERDLRAEAVSATEAVVTDDTFGAAKPLMAQTRARLQARVKPLVERGVIPVITGYIGATEAGVTTTLGRGGSDFTAAIVAAGLDADEVWIWSDVDGILTADPNIVPQARTLPELSYSEAADLAYYGADVLHPKTVGPVVAANIPLRLRNSFHPQHPGTLVLQSPRADRQRLPAIISTDGLTLIAVGSRDDAPLAASWNLALTARALQCLSAAGVDVPMFSQSFSEHTLNLVLREQDQAHALRVLKSEFDQLDAAAFMLGVKEKVATISVVGVPGWNSKGIVSHAFAALGELGTRVIAVAQAATEYNVSFCIPEDQMADAVRFLHRELGLEQNHES